MAASLWYVLNCHIPNLNDVVKFRHRLALPDMKYLGAYAVTVPRSSTSSQEVDTVL